MDFNKKKLKNLDKDIKKSDLFLKKHVGLIHCENKLTLVQRKICNVLLFNALDKINDCDIYEIPLRKLCSLVEYNSHDINLIKTAIKSLISVVMEWNLLDDNKFLNDKDFSEDSIAWNASSLLAGASIKNGLIHYSYSPQMKSVLSSLEIYGRINLFVQAKFNSTYSLVLYENCVRFKNLKQTSWFSIELFRSLMGVRNDKYRSFKEFKRNVINIAVNEINQKSDIYLTPQYRKSVRSITAIQFLLSENENYQPAFKRLLRDDVSLINPKVQTTVVESLTSEFQLSLKQAKDIAKRYERNYLQEKINLVKSQSNIDHPGAYLISALKKDYKKKTPPIRKANITTIEYGYQREAKDAHEIVSLKNKYMTYKLKMYNNFIHYQTATVQATIKKNFEQFLKLNIELLRHYKKKALSSPMTMSAFIKFIEDNYPHIIGEYLGFDDYMTAES